MEYIPRPMATTIAQTIRCGGPALDHTTTLVIVHGVCLLLDHIPRPPAILAHQQTAARNLDGGPRARKADYFNIEARQQHEPYLRLRSTAVDLSASLELESMSFLGGVRMRDIWLDEWRKRSGVLHKVQPGLAA